MTSPDSFPCRRLRGSKTKGCRTLPAIEPALETTDPATVLAALAELVAVSTRLVTAALRRYQITRRLMALDLGVLFLGSDAEELSGSF